MKSFDGGSTGCPENRLTARSKLPHHAFTGEERPRYGRAQRREHQRGLRRRSEVVGHLRGVVRGVLVVLVEWRRPRRLLGPRIDVHGACEVVHGGQQLAGHLGNGTIGRERDLERAPVAVLDDRIVALQIERNDERARSVGCRQREGLPSPRREPQRGVLQLWLGRSQCDRQLPEHLRVRVQRVAGGLPRLVREHDPRSRRGGHDDASVRVCIVVRMGVPARTASVTGVRSATEARRSRCSSGIAESSVIVRSIDAAAILCEVIANIDFHCGRRVPLALRVHAQRHRSARRQTAQEQPER